jgi:hypothetical protein
MIRIVHTRASGTLLFGAARDDALGLVIASARDRWWFYPALGGEGAWYLTNSRGHRARHTAIDRLAVALRADGHEVEVTITTSSNATAAIETVRTPRTSGARHTVAPLGQPVITDQYAALLTRLHQAEFTTRTQLATSRDRPEATTSPQPDRHQPRSIMGRIKRLESELHHWQRTRATLDPASNRSGSDAAPSAEADRQIAEVTDQLDFWRAELTTSHASGVFRSWTPDDFRTGDQARILDAWRPVLKVNPTTLTVDLSSHDDGHHPDAPLAAPTHAAAYDTVHGRRRDDKQLHHPPPAEGASCTCPTAIPTLNVGFNPERDDGPCAEPAVLRLLIHHDGTTCGCDGACQLRDTDTDLVDLWTEVVLFCIGHAYQCEADTVAALTTGTAIVEDLS